MEKGCGELKGQRMSARRVKVAPCLHKVCPALMSGENICFLILQLMSKYRESSWRMEIPSLWILSVSLQEMEDR